MFPDLSPELSHDLCAAPLGQRVNYPSQYDPSVLFPIARSQARAGLALPDHAASFHGADIWNAYELSWLDARGMPRVALARFEIPADSPNIVESKSFKLYLNSYNQTQIADWPTLHGQLLGDVSQAVDAPVGLALIPAHEFATESIDDLAGRCLDEQTLTINAYQPDPGLLHTKPGGEVEETLMSRLLRSNCPVTGQPDWGCVQIAYRGAPIDHAGLLRYIVSFRLHTGFHEHCVERMYCDLMTRCRPRSLRVYARYTRRGGLDINPWRATADMPAPDTTTRTARQ